MTQFYRPWLARRRCAFVALTSYVTLSQVGYAERPLDDAIPSAPITATKKVSPDAAADAPKSVAAPEKQVEAAAAPSSGQSRVLAAASVAPASPASAVAPAAAEAATSKSAGAVVPDAKAAVSDLPAKAAAGQETAAASAAKSAAPEAAVAAAPAAAVAAASVAKAAAAPEVPVVASASAAPAAPAEKVAAPVAEVSAEKATASKAASVEAATSAPAQPVAKTESAKIAAKSASKDTEIRDDYANEAQHPLDKSMQSPYDLPMDRSMDPEEHNRVIQKLIAAEEDDEEDAMPPRAPASFLEVQSNTVTDAAAATYFDDYRRSAARTLQNPWLREEVLLRKTLNDARSRRDQEGDLSAASGYAPKTASAAEGYGYAPVASDNGEAAVAAQYAESAGREAAMREEAAPARYRQEVPASYLEQADYVPQPVENGAVAGPAYGEERGYDVAGASDAGFGPRSSREASRRFSREGNSFLQDDAEVAPIADGRARRPNGRLARQRASRREQQLQPQPPQMQQQQAMAADAPPIRSDAGRAAPTSDGASLVNTLRSLEDVVAERDRLQHENTNLQRRLHQATDGWAAPQPLPPAGAQPSAAAYAGVQGGRVAAATREMPPPQEMSGYSDQPLSAQYGYDGYLPQRAHMQQQRASALAEQEAAQRRLFEEEAAIGASPSDSSAGVGDLSATPFAGSLENAKRLNTAVDKIWWQMKEDVPNAFRQSIKGADRYHQALDEVQKTRSTLGQGLSTLRAGARQAHSRYADQIGSALRGEPPAGEPLGY
eukprot:TRINITY_DN29134_c0_g3_i1.p1 TRINITY_DN29134_c0_g3~~TRINITY_DN29134_c0_g3_i1.p1  ORF type:complete len:776 (-),score=183.58 TRINITY_DN29134_c0_g3_i1:276-2603(-)